MIYVDPATHFWRGRHWGHLFTDGDLQELHDLALRLGLRRSWFQDEGNHPHYDVTQQKRLLALQLGARAVTAHEAGLLFREMRRQRQATEGESHD